MSRVESFPPLYPCPNCHKMVEAKHVMSVRRSGESIVRHRRCERCGHQFTTMEFVATFGG